MIVLDANILIYLHTADSPFHDQTRVWFEKAMDERIEIGIPWLSISAFLRILTHPRLSLRPGTMEYAIGAVDELLSHSNIHLLTESLAHWTMMKDMLRKGQAVGDLVTDAKLAALAMEHAASICSNDRDFARFPGLRIVNPINKQ